MRKPTPSKSGLSGRARPQSSAQHVHTTYDSFGVEAARYTFFPDSQILYVRWQGHFTGDEFVRAANTGLLLNQQWQPRGLFHDLRESSGEWGADGAGAWLEYEWIPGIQAHCPQLRGIAALLDAKQAVPYANTQLLTLLGQQFYFRAFYSLLSAWRWMNQRTRPHAAIG